MHMIFVDGVPITQQSCTINDGHTDIPNCAPPSPPALEGGTDLFLWLVAWVTSEDKVRVEWKFDGNADEYKVYKNGIFLSSTTLNYILDDAWVDTDQYMIEAWIDGELIDSIGPTVIDTDLTDCNLLLIGKIVGMDCHSLENIPCYVYNESKTADFANRSLISKIELFTQTDADGVYCFYVKRGLRITLHVPSADLMRKITLPEDEPAYLVDAKGGSCAAPI